MPGRPSTSLAPRPRDGHLPGRPRGPPCLGARTVVVSGTQVPFETPHRLTGRAGGTEWPPRHHPVGALGFLGEGPPMSALGSPSDRGRHAVHGARVSRGPRSHRPHWEALLSLLWGRPSATKVSQGPRGGSPCLLRLRGPRALPGLRPPPSSLCPHLHVPSLFHTPPLPSLAGDTAIGRRALRDRASRRFTWFYLP